MVIPLRTEQPVFFQNPSDFRLWLVQHGETEKEIWVGFYKKNSGKVAMNYDQALDEVLCFGWIDGIVKKHDELSYKQRYTPRRPKSVWSKINTQHVERLIREGKMMPAGSRVIEEAKRDGRWDRAYDSAKNSQIPDEFMTHLNKNKKAKAFFATLNKTNIYAIAYRLQTAKTEKTKNKRTLDIIQKLVRNEKFY